MLLLSTFLAACITVSIITFFWFNKRFCFISEKRKHPSVPDGFTHIDRRHQVTSEAEWTKYVISLPRPALEDCFLQILLFHLLDKRYLEQIEAVIRSTVLLLRNHHVCAMLSIHDNQAVCDDSVSLESLLQEARSLSKKSAELHGLELMRIVCLNPPEDVLLVPETRFYGAVALDVRSRSAPRLSRFELREEFVNSAVRRDDLYVRSWILKLNYKLLHNEMTRDFLAITLLHELSHAKMAFAGLQGQPQLAVGTPLRFDAAGPVTDRGTTSRCMDDGGGMVRGESGDLLVDSIFGGLIELRCNPPLLCIRRVNLKATTKRNQIHWFKAPNNFLANLFRDLLDNPQLPAERFVVPTSKSMTFDVKDRKMLPFTSFDTDDTEMHAGSPLYPPAFVGLCGGDMSFDELVAEAEQHRARQAVRDVFDGAREQFVLCQRNARDPPEQSKCRVSSAAKSPPPARTRGNNKLTPASSAGAVRGRRRPSSADH